MLQMNLRCIGSIALLLTSAVGVLPLASRSTAASNPPVQMLGVGLVPPGAILPYGGTVAPPGFLLCDGTEVLQDTYPRLFDAIGNGFGSSSAFTFRVPDLRGRFMRGVDGTAGNDPNSSSRSAIYPGGNVGNKVGSLQADGRKGFSGTFSAAPSRLSSWHFRGVGEETPCLDALRNTRRPPQAPARTALRQLQVLKCVHRSSSGRARPHPRRTRAGRLPSGVMRLDVLPSIYALIAGAAWVDLSGPSL